jgi:hypothetical protein
MTDARCETCRWYEPYEKTHYGYSNDLTDGLCLRAGGADGRPEHPDTLAFARDVEQYGADLLVRRAFGCVMYEAGQ